MPCMVRGCSTLVLKTKVACTFHWSLVPMDIKRQIWSVYEDALDASVLALALRAAAARAEAGDLRQKQTVG